MLVIIKDMLKKYVDKSATESLQKEILYIASLHDMRGLRLRLMHLLMPRAREVKENNSAGSL